MSLTMARQVLLVFVCLIGSLPTKAGSLEFFEASVGPGVTLEIPAPATDVLLDIHYNATSAEGGGFYGFSEVKIIATGDVVFTSTGFACEAYSCLYFPNPFVSGPSVVATAADDLSGEFSSPFDMLTISVTGTAGYIALLRGEYIDASGASMNLGAIQSIDATILATVPEPGLGVTLSLGGLLLVGLQRARRHRPSCNAAL